MTDVASLGLWPLGDLPGVCVRRNFGAHSCPFFLGPVALGPRVLTSRLPPPLSNSPLRGGPPASHWVSVSLNCAILD